MKIAIIGSRRINIKNIDEYILDGVTEIVSGGAKGVDSDAKEYAERTGIKYTEFLPQYDKYKKAAPLKRNIEIIEYSDRVIAFWDGSSKGTRFVIEECRKRNKTIDVFVIGKRYDGC